MKIKTKKTIQTEEEIELPITLIDEVVYLHYYASGGWNSLFKVKTEGLNINYIHYDLSNNKIIKKSITVNSLFSKIEDFKIICISEYRINFLKGYGHAETEMLNYIFDLHINYINEIIKEDFENAISNFINLDI
jgi:hypothetical protein